MAATSVLSRSLLPFTHLPKVYSSQCLFRTKGLFLRPPLLDSVAKVSVSCALAKDPGSPKKSGDKGPGKNFNKKIAKQNKMNSGWGGSGMQLESLLEGMKNVDIEEENGENLSSLLGDVPVEEVHKESKEYKKSSTVPKGTSNESSSTNELMDLLSDMKIDDFKRSSDRVKSEDSRRSDVSKGNCRFLDATVGPRLNIFNHPKPEVKIMPEGKPTYSKFDENKKLQALMLLKPWCYYDNLLQEKGVPYPRTFPVDNENYDQGEEANVGFEDHVLLDHLLNKFPARGPVRHFMELVVTGLSKNPYYTAAEKQDIVSWYANYFKEFSPEELQSLEQMQSA